MEGDAKQTSGVEKVDDGFTLVQKRKKRINIIGSKKSTSTKNFKGNFKSARKMADLYIGNCDENVTCEIISQYIVDEMNIKIENCVALVPKSGSSSSSFKITLNLDDRLKLLSPDVWPEGIVCRKFYSPRSLNSS